MPVEQLQQALQAALAHITYEGAHCDVLIDYEFLLDLYNRQEGRCAVTGLEMVYRFQDLRSISINRTDSNRGFIPDNVQLVCGAVIQAAKYYSQAEMLEFIREIRATSHRIVVVRELPVAMPATQCGLFGFLLEEIAADRSLRFLPVHVAAYWVKSIDRYYGSLCVVHGSRGDKFRPVILHVGVRDTTIAVNYEGDKYQYYDLNHSTSLEATSEFVRAWLRNEYQ